MATQETTTRPLLSPPPARVPRGIRLSALLLALYVAGAHLGLAEDRYKHDARWVGSVFVVGALVLTVAGAIAAAESKFGPVLIGASWLGTGIVAVGLLALFVLSRTVGLPGYSRSDVPVIQVLAALAECGYAALAACALTAMKRARR
jgi:hypothetical protein